MSNKMNNMHPGLVSVIIPTFNYSQYIVKAIESVRSQAYQNWECIIVDDGSTDDTGVLVTDIARKDSRIKYIYQNNQGLSAARNTGIRHSRGEYIQFLDSDDLLEISKIQRQVEYLELNPFVDIVYGPAKSFDLTNDSRTSMTVRQNGLPWVPVITGSPRDALLTLIKIPFPVHCALVRQSVIADIGLFDESLKACEDWQFWIRCAIGGKTYRYYKADDCAALYRMHDASMCANPSLMRNGRRRLRREISKLVRDREALRLNQELSSAFEGYEGVREIQKNNLLSGMLLCFRAGLTAPDWRQALKWFYCAIAAMWVPVDKFERLVATPLTQSVRRFFKFRKAT